MGKNMLKFTRGQVWWINAAKYDVDPLSHIQQKDRPYLIVSCDENNRISPTFNAVPITKQDKNPIPSHVTYTIGDKQNTILCEQIRTFDMDDLGRYCYVLDDKIMKKVDEALASQLCINVFGSSINNLMEVIDKIIKSKKELVNKDREISDKIVDDVSKKLNSLFLSPIQEKKSLNSDIEENNGDNKSLGSNIKEINEEKKSSFFDEEPETPKVQDIEIKRTPIANIKSDGSKKWTPERKKQFMEDCDKYSVDQVAKMWGLKNKQSVYSYKYIFAKEK